MKITKGSIPALFVALAVATPAFADTKTDAKKETKPDAPATDSKAVENKADAKTDDGKTDASGSVKVGAGGVSDSSAHAPEVTHINNNSPVEDETSLYQFIGVRYRPTIIPKFIVNMFVDEGRTFVSHSVALEYERRRDDFSTIFGLQFAEYGFDDTLFAQKGKPRSIAGNWSLANSSLKGLYFTMDMLWSTKINKNFAFEYGFGVGLGAIFGPLGLNWVYPDGNGKFTGEQGERFNRCEVGDVNQAGKAGCSPRDHSNSSTVNVGDYKEPNWFEGGSKPAIFPHISLPNLGIRFKPMRQVVARAQMGFSLTGFWFGLGASFGLPPKAKQAKPRNNDVEVVETVE